MRLSGLFPRLGFIIATCPCTNHKSENQHRRSNAGDINAPTVASTTSPPSPTPSSPDLVARTGGFTDPLIPTHPTLFYETATAFRVISGITVFTTYTDLISGTVAIPFTASTELNLSALPTTTSAIVAPSLVFPIEPSIPAGSPTPTLDLGACLTAVGEGAQACGNGVIASFNSVHGGKSTSGGGGSVGVGVAPTRTVTEPYLGAEVAKGEATWVVGALGNGGLREMGSVLRKVCSLFPILGGWMMVWVFW